MSAPAKQREPARIRLTEDYVDLEVGMAYPKGTVLVRTSSGQYAKPGTRLGQECVAGLFRLRDLKAVYEVLEP